MKNKWIAVTHYNDEKQMIINTEKIEKVYPVDDNTIIVFDSRNSVVVKDSFESIMDCLL